MVKTKADLKNLRVSAKAPRKFPSPSTASSPTGRSSKKYEGGNTVCPRETPEWQKKITQFFPPKSSGDGGNTSSEAASSSETGSETQK